MNVLRQEKKIAILAALIEGNSIRSTERMTGVHRDTIMRLLLKTGEHCRNLLFNKMRNLECRRLQVDEIWTFVQRKQQHIHREEDDSKIGDQYVFVAIDADTKLVPAFAVGKRNRKTAIRFLDALKKKLAKRPQLTTDGFGAYLVAVERVFGADVDFAQLIKIYGPNGDRTPYPPPSVKGTEKHTVIGQPDRDYVSTSYVERQNLTMRMQMRRFTRLTNAFSKKLINLKAALAIHFAQYNFCRIHSTLRVTPAIEAGITNEVWGLERLLA